MSTPTDPPWFAALADAVCSPTPGADRVSLALQAEASDFIRFNHAVVRQATAVRQAHATLAVMAGRRRIESTLSLSGNGDADAALLCAERDALLADLPLIPDDPFLLLPDRIVDTHRHEHGRLPQAAELIATVSDAARGLDLVGFHAAGPVVRAFGDSRGQRNWHHVETFQFDWCLYRHRDKAVKSRYAGSHWQADTFAARLSEAARQLPLLAQPPAALAAGSYRAFFTPTAMAELLSTAGWGGFGIRERRTGTSSMMRLAGGARLHPGFTLREDTAHGVAPAFTADGFVKPDEVLLVADGQARDTLNSPRSAREFGIVANGAGPFESPESASLAPGELPIADALAALDSGLYISDLWYLNYSDRPAARVTGMTRFACFRVEHGRLAEPLPVMRFDDSLLRMFGSGLLALTRETELLPDSSTYQQRQLASVSTPGALIDQWRLTL